MGTVIHVAVNSDDDGVTYKPTVKYTVDGHEYEAKSWMSSSGYDFRIGEKIPILYEIDEPGNIRLNFFMEKWGFGGIFATVGGILFIGSLAIGRKGKPSRRKQKRSDPQPDDYKPLPTDPGPGDVLRRDGHQPTIRRQR